MEGPVDESATPPPGAWAPPPLPPPPAFAAGDAPAGEWTAAPPAPYPYPYPAPALYQTLPGWGWGWGWGWGAVPEDSIPAAWGAAGCGASEAWRSATWPPAELGAAELAAGALPAAAWEQQGMGAGGVMAQQPCCLDPQCAGCPLPHPAAGWAAGPPPQFEACAALAAAQQQQGQLLMDPQNALLAATQQQQALYYQQQCPPPHLQPSPPLAFAISAPAPAPASAAPPRRPSAQPRLARKKKAALPAEPSFGSNGDGLGGGGGSAALVFSGEPSTAELEVVEGVAEEEAGAGGADQGEHCAGSEGEGAGAGVPRLAPARQLAAQPSIAYDRSPRPTAWAPFTFAEYQVPCQGGCRGGLAGWLAETSRQPAG